MQPIWAFLSTFCFIFFIYQINVRKCKHVFVDLLCINFRLKEVPSNNYSSSFHFDVSISFSIISYYIIIKHELIDCIVLDS